jgi:hypothetical protein
LNFEILSSLTGRACQSDPCHPFTRDPRCADPTHRLPRPFSPTGRHYANRRRPLLPPRERPLHATTRPPLTESAPLRATGPCIFGGCCTNPRSSALWLLDPCALIGHPHRRTPPSPQTTGVPISPLPNQRKLRRVPPSCPTRTHLVWRAHVSLAICDGVAACNCSGQSFRSDSTGLTASGCALYLRPPLLTFCPHPDHCCPPVSNATLSSVFRCREVSPSDLTTAYSSTRAGPGVASNLDVAQRATGVAPCRSEHRRNTAAPPPDPLFGERAVNTVQSFILSCSESLTPPSSCRTRSERCRPSHHPSIVVTSSPHR